MHPLRLLAIVFCTVLGTTSAAGASQTAQLPGTTGGPSPLLAAGALIAAAALRRLLRAAAGSTVTAPVARPDHESDLVLPPQSTDARGVASWADLVDRGVVDRRFQIDTADDHLMDAPLLPEYCDAISSHHGHH